ncbi:MAG: hypothetical protein LBQ36_03580 [Synergistaceae bacterium]|nr:hypothetical protein [Synergistaceae bacterium]
MPTLVRRFYISVIALLASISFGIGCASLGALPANAGTKRDIPPGITMDTEVLPVLAGLQVTQIGGDTLSVKIRGFELPVPRAVSAPGEAKLVLQWDGARFPQTIDKRDWWSDYQWDVLTIDGAMANKWWKQYDLPLLNRINADPVDFNSLRLTFTTTQPLVIERIEGVAGADDMDIILTAYKPEKPAEAPPKPVQYGRGDPMGITAPVTLQMRNADIKTVFRMLADLQKLNLLIDPSVPDMQIDFSFNGVPFRDAFGYLLRATELSYSVTNGMLVIGREESLGRVLDTEVVRAYTLSYAVDEAGQVRPDVTAALTGLISLPKAPTLDARNRQLYVTATEEQHSRVAALLEKLDQPGRQVMLEARIFEVSDSGTQELETLVTAVYNHWLASFTGSGGLNPGYNYASVPYADNPSWSLPVGGSIGGSPVWETIPLEGVKMLSAGLHAIETKGKGKNIANPSVITIDGQTSTVALTQNVKYASGVDSNGNVSFSEVQSGPRLNFLPIIGRDGMVTIKVEIETGEILNWRNAGMGAQAPETSSRKVQTTVRVRNGEPFVVGGLYQDNKSTVRNRIPVLGHLPLLGDLFSYRHDEHRKTEVAMIVIPYILNVPDGAIETIDLKKSSLLR